MHAVVVARPGAELDEAAVIAHARDALASYKVPRSVSWSDELPKTGSGKVLKRELRAPFWAGRVVAGLSGVGQYAVSVAGLMRSGFVTLAGRPNVGQVDARQRPLRAEGVDRQRQAADDTPPGSWRADPPRGAAGVRRHARACTSRSRRSASRSTRPRSTASRASMSSCLVLDATKPFGKGDQWVAAAPRRARRRS